MNVISQIMFLVTMVMSALMVLFVLILYEFVMGKDIGVTRALEAIASKVKSWMP